MKFNFVKYSKNRNEKFAFSSGHSVLYLLKWLTELHEVNSLVELGCILIVND